MIDFLTLKNQLCFALYETSSELTKLYTNVLKEFELTYPQYLVLLALWNKDGLTVKELGNELSLGTGTLTPMLARMQTNGWLRKHRSTEDERKVLIHLQEKAQQHKQVITEKIASEIELCNISIDEYEQLITLLHSLKMKITHR
ncbi:MarR family winged helix-turn-helix transcriptional regulator [Metabacillus malikii]|uniref:MarR family transcriptional regulator n=1 Tax=Metabacillus malikii TaxID=1504265 RepID=A0ABT9ZHF4_9BACI|nr:MarR family transcriptional regulator [Metabacillus malikii]MDQ0231706.1 MarR family transcriptional regulator [Metabacillus malikii]